MQLLNWQKQEIEYLNRGGRVKRFFEDFKIAILAMMALPLGLIMYLVYVHVVSLLDPILSIVFGGGFLLAILICIFSFFVNLKDFVVSIFKDDDTLDERGFKKHL